MIGPYVRIRSVRQSASLFVSFILEVELLQDVFLVAEFAIRFVLFLDPLKELRLQIRGVLPRLKRDEVTDMEKKKWIGK